MTTIKIKNEINIQIELLGKKRKKNENRRTNDKERKKCLQTSTFFSIVKFTFNSCVWMICVNVLSLWCSWFLLRKFLVHNFFRHTLATDYYYFYINKYENELWKKIGLLIWIFTIKHIANTSAICRRNLGDDVLLWENQLWFYIYSLCKRLW